MNEAHVCSFCGAPSSHEGGWCCWCWVVNKGQDPVPTHAECVASVRRLDAVQQRFRDAVLAEREGCARCVEELKDIHASQIPQELVRDTRRNPRKILAGITNIFIETVTRSIRARVDPIPALKGSGR